MIFDHGEVRAYCSARLPGLKQSGDREFRGPCPVHQGKDPNFVVDPNSGLAHCHSRCGRGWDLISLEQELSGLDFPRAKERVFELVGRPKVPWEERNVTAIYDYTDAQGKLLYQVLRYVGKEFKQRRADGSWGLGGIERVPYRLEKLHSSRFAAIVEGEKDVLTLERIGMVATCNNGGAGNFKSELAQYFAGKDVAIFPDNDDPGREHAIKIAAMLSPVAQSVKIVELPDLPAKGDISDFVAAGGKLEDLRELYRKATIWSVDWEFGSSVPDENEKYIHDFTSGIEAAGGLTEFWNLGTLVGLETPWRKLSRALGGGMRNGEFYVIGANQGAGKTSMALQFIMAAIRRHEGVLMFSMEMGWRSVFQRMAAIEARVNLLELTDCQYIVRKRASDPETRLRASSHIEQVMPVLCKATSELASLPLLVSTKSSIHPEYIAEETARLRKRAKIKLVVVDHMQLMRSTGSTRGDYEKFTAISRDLKQTAVDLDIPVLLLSQTSRANSNDKRGELEVSDLRGSGAIEEDAAAVMLLYEDKQDKDLAMGEGDGMRYTRGPVKCWLKLGKNRYGEQGRSFEFRHTKHCTRFDLPEDME